MDDRAEFCVRFWGVRGSIACPGPDTVRYGGNTSCLEVKCGEHLMIFDAGTGLRSLGNELLKQMPIDLDLFLTHTHFDHVCGLPFFVPFFVPSNKVRIHAGHLVPDFTLRQVLVEMMMAPLFPVPPSIFQADVIYTDFQCGETLCPYPNVTLRTAPLNHPNNATGYRIEFDGRAVCYVTDYEHFDDRRDDVLIGLVRDADYLIYDSTYSDEEYERFKGFGHSTWQEGVRLAEEAGVETLVIFHHDPGHDDAWMDRVAKEAETARPGTIVAQEGMALRP